jgi:RNA polymerase sigma factor (sigma-70 family)
MSTHASESDDSNEVSPAGRSQPDELTSADLTNIAMILDPGQFGTLYEVYFQRIFSYFRSLGFSHHQAEDLAADFFVAFRGKVQHYNPARGRFRSFLRTCVRHFLIDWLRKTEGTKIRIPQSVLVWIDQTTDDDQAQDLPDPNPGNPLDTMDRSLLKLVYDTALAEFNRKETARTAEYLHFQPFFEPAAEPPSIESIAATLGLPPATARKRLHDLRKRFRNDFTRAAEDMGFPPDELRGL